MLPRSQIGRLAVAGGLAGAGGGAVVAAGNREPVWGKAAGGAVIGAGLLAGAGVAGTKNGPLARDVAGWRAGWRRGGKLGRILSMKLFSMKNRTDGTNGTNGAAALRPGMIEFAKVDLGEDRDRYLGEVGAMPSAPKKWYPSLHVSGLAKELPLPDEGKATITYKVKRRSSEKYDGKEQHSATIEVQTIETPASAAKGGLRRGKPGAVKRLFSASAASGLRRDKLRLEFSDRPRNGDGQFVANETGGADPNSMAAAYGNVAAEKAARRRSLVRRIKAMFGGKNQVASMSALAPGMVEFGRGERSIAALKKALARGIGNGGEAVSIHRVGVEGSIIPALRKNPKNVQRAWRRFTGDAVTLKDAEASMMHERKWAARAIRDARRQRQ